MKDIRKPRHPVEFWVPLFLFLLGFGLVTGETPRPGSINAFLKPWEATVWGWGTFVGSVMMLVSFAWRNRATGIAIEQVAHVMLGVVVAIYAVAVADAPAPGSTFTAALAGSLALSFFWRAAQLYRYVRQVAKVAEGAATHRTEPHP